MDVTGDGQARYKLSICITTLNRADFIGATLESILSQVTSSCEVVVLDGASSDNTAEIVQLCASRFENLRYIRQDRNNGLDQDIDGVVKAADGEYCWLMSDDDLMKPGAIASVLTYLQKNVSLIGVNVESRDFSMRRVVQARWVSFEFDREYAPDQLDRLFTEIGEVWRYIGNVIIKRSIWMSRERPRYYGSYFLYVGVIFQKALPGKAVFIAEPLVSYRMSNTHAFTRETLEILWVRWPALVSTLALSDEAKAKVSAHAWRRPLELLLWRALGYYSLDIYRCLILPRRKSPRDVWLPVVIALIPRTLAKLGLVAYYASRRRSLEGAWWQAMLFIYQLRLSRSPFRNLGALKRQF